MFEKLLVPLDGSLLAECVLPHVKSTAKAFAAEVVLLRVVEGANGATTLPADPLAYQMRKVEAKASLERVRYALQDAGIETREVILEGVAADRITEYARANDFDLLILSTHGSSGLEPWRAGSVAQKVIERAKTSILLVRAFQEPVHHATLQRYGRVMVSLDGSQRAEAALAPAVALAERANAELVLAHVVLKPSCFPYMSCPAESRALVEELTRRNRAQAHDYLERLQKRLPVPSQVRVLVADKIMGALQELAEQEQIDLVVGSAHGQGCDRRRRYGSVMSETIAYGAAPLLVYQDMHPEQMAATAAESVVREQASASNWRREPLAAGWRTA
ncbi:MAG TPA: universal stress protein [Candidatus Binatia bacterium]|nr:universal stress protein [Candidatus Binatia bacterium]